MSTKAVAKVSETQWAVTKTTPEKASRALQSVAGAGGFTSRDLPIIKVPAGGGQTWEIPTAGGLEPMKEFQAIVLCMHDARRYWAAKYGSGEAGPPQCMSNDGLRGVGSPGGACARCLLNRRPEHSDDMTCRPSRTVYMLLPDMVLPAVLNVPLMSLSNADDYFKKGLAAFGVEPSDVITTIGLTTAPSSGGIRYSKVTFAKAGDVPESMREQVDKYRDSFQAMLAESHRAQEEIAREFSGSGSVEVDGYGAPVAADLDDDNDDIPA